MWFDKDLFEGVDDDEEIEAPDSIPATKGTKRLREGDDSDDGPTLKKRKQENAKKNQVDTKVDNGNYSLFI